MTTNEKPGFTPGPWTPEGFDDWGDGTNLPLELDVRVNGSRWDKIVDSISISDANAHLIAAAPDLYAELEGGSDTLLGQMLGMIEDSGDSGLWATAKAWMERRDELLAKARGEA